MINLIKGYFQISSRLLRRFGKSLHWGPGSTIHRTFLLQDGSGMANEYLNTNDSHPFSESIVWGVRYVIITVVNYTSEPWGDAQMALLRTIGDGRSTLPTLGASPPVYSTEAWRLSRWAIIGSNWLLYRSVARHLMIWSLDRILMCERFCAMPRKVEFTWTAGAASGSIHMHQYRNAALLHKVLHAWPRLCVFT